MGERLLVNFFYAQPVGHAIEALHYCNGYHEADPSLQIAVALNAATPVELASYCSFEVDAYGIAHPFLEPGSAPLDVLPPSGDWIIDDGGRYFGLAALAVGTPWLTIAGGRWFEYFFNRAPFRSIIPEPRALSDLQPVRAPALRGQRIVSMSDARIREDLDRIVAAALELTSGSLDYERALRECFRDLLAAHGGDASAIWSIDDVHLDHLA